MTHSVRRARIFAVFVAIFVALFLAFPHAVRAQPVVSEVEPVYGVEPQGASDLRATIQNSLLSDPRTSGLSQSQIDAVVNVLLEEAQKNGLTSGDIEWRPQDTGSFIAIDETAVVSICGSGLLCLFSEAFGFVGPDATIPFALGVASMGLAWIFAVMLHRRRS